MFSALRSQRFSRPLGLGCVRLAATIPVFFASVVHARTELAVDATVSAEESSNPFLVDANDTQSAAVAVTVTPSWTLTEAVGTARLSGTVRHTEFLRRYPSSQSVFASAGGSWNASLRTTVQFNLSYTNSSSSDFDFFRFEEPGQEVPTDVTLNGFRSRQEQVQSNASVSHQLNERWNLGANAFASSTKISGVARANDYATFGGGAQMSARIDAAGTVGASLSVSRYECRSGPACQSLVTQPQFTASAELAPGWTLDVSAGVAINRLRLPLERRTTTSPSGSIQTCRKDSRNSYCLSVAQEIAQTAVSGPRSALSVTGSWRHRLSETDNIGLSFGYAGTSSGEERLNDEKFRNWTARINGSTRIARNMSLTIDGGYLQNRSAIAGRRSNAEVSMGIRISLGRKS